MSLFLNGGGTRRHSWLRLCATSRKVPGSIPNGVTGIFHSHNPFDRTMALVLTQSLIEMSTGNISRGVKAAGTYGWHPNHLHVPIVLKSGSLNLLEPSGAVQGCNGITLLFHFEREPAWQQYDRYFSLLKFWQNSDNLESPARRNQLKWFLVNDQLDAQIPFYVFIFIYNSLHISSTSCSSSGETNCINKTSGSYQSLYWQNLSLLMMSTMCSKHVES